MKKQYSLKIHIDSMQREGGREGESDHSLNAKLTKVQLHEVAFYHRSGMSISRCSRQSRLDLIHFIHDCGYPFVQPKPHLVNCLFGLPHYNDLSISFTSHRLEILKLIDCLHKLVMDKANAGVQRHQDAHLSDLRFPCFPRSQRHAAREAQLTENGTMAIWV